MILDSGIPGFPSIYTTGNVFWVDSGSGADSDGAGAHDDPFATIDFAVGKCKANQGDYIICKPGHREPALGTNDGIEVDVAGVSLVGLGVGSDRPTVTITAVTADFQISAANFRIHNFLFIGGVDAISGAIAIAATDCSLTDIETRDAASTQATDFISASFLADRLEIRGWIHRGDSSAGADSAFTITGGDDVSISDFQIYGNFAVSAIDNLTNAGVRWSISDGYIQNLHSDDVVIELRPQTTGNIGPNLYIRLADDAANITEATVGADMQFFQPVEIVNADGESSMQTNISVST